MSITRQLVFSIAFCALASFATADLMAQQGSTPRDQLSSATSTRRKIKVTKTITGPAYQKKRAEADAVDTPTSPQKKLRVTTINSVDPNAPEHFTAPTPNVKAIASDHPRPRTQSLVPLPGSTPVTEVRIAARPSELARSTSYFRPSSTVVPDSIEPSSDSETSRRPVQLSTLFTDETSQPASMSFTDSTLGGKEKVNDGWEPLPSNLTALAPLPAAQASASSEPSSASSMLGSRSGDEVAFSGAVENFSDATKQIDTPNEQVVAPSSKMATPAVIQDLPPAERVASVPAALRTVPAKPAKPAMPAEAKAATALSMSGLNGMSFKSPTSFVANRKYKFTDANKYLASPKTESPGKPNIFTKLPSIARNPASKAAELSATENAAEFTPIGLPTTSVGASAIFDGTEEDEYLTVASVDDPIQANPFARIKQSDSFNLLDDTTAEKVPFVGAATWAEFADQPEFPHVATYQAHNFKYRPLYFEEVNLERYGNQLPLQNFASAAHFFTSAALLPYKIGSQSPKCCISTLGYERPGDCVPYRIHRRPFSRRGLIYQGLAVTAIAL